MVLAITADKNWEVIQVDVNTAFLYASFEEEEKVLVEMAPGFVQFTKDGVRYVMDLQKSLYGLAQSPRNWWKTVDPKLIEIGFVPLKSDSCVYIYQHKSTTVIITLYVDDLLIIGCDITVINGIKKKLMEKFKMSDLGNVSLVLGMQVTRDRAKGSLTISQESYTASILERFGMGNCKPLSTPGYGSELSTVQPEATLLGKVDTQRYQAIVGSVMYLAQVTRYDIMYACSQLARALSKPSKVHMGAAKHLLRYLAGTKDFAITCKRGKFTLDAFSDANWGNNPDNGKSTSCYIVLMCKAPISFKTGQQSLTAMSTMEAELVAGALAMKEAVFCSSMMKEFLVWKPVRTGAGKHRQHGHSPRHRQPGVQLPDQTYRSSLLLRTRACERRGHQHPLHPDGEPAGRHRHRIPEQAAPSLLDQQHQEFRKLILVFRKYFEDLFRRFRVDRLFYVYILTTVGNT